MQLNLYVLSLLVAGLVSGVVAAIAWRRRSVTAGRELALLMLAAAVWSLAQCVEASVTTHLGKISWSTVSYLGSQTIPVLFLLVVLRYTGQDHWLNSRRIAMLLVLPGLSILMAATNGLHGLVWPQVTLVDTHLGIAAIYQHGIWFWTQTLYSYALVLIGLTLLFRAFRRTPSVYSWQAKLLFFAALVPLAGHIVYAFGPAEVAYADITPIAFSVTGVLITTALLRYRLLDLRPLASKVLYAGIQDAILAVDTDDRIVDMNPAAARIVGEAADRAVGQPVSQLYPVLPGLRECLAQNGEETPREVSIVNSGTSAYYDLRVWPLRDLSDHMLGRLITLHDVTDFKMSQDELRMINAELDGYAHTVSHDLKGPLTTVTLAAQALGMVLEEPECEERNRTVHSTLGAMQRSADKAVALINGLLALAEAGQRPLEVAGVSVNDIVRRVLEENSAAIEEQGIRVTLDDLGEIRADPTHMYQLFANLIGNAIIHGTGQAPHIEVRNLGREGDVHRYLVRDNGPGVPEADLERIFTPFYRVDKTGTGIGLSTARRIANVYRGEIHAFNDRGACFEFTLRDYMP
jgi:PAS domain S-box-containing protein